MKSDGKRSMFLFTCSTRRRVSTPYSSARSSSSMTGRRARDLRCKALLGQFVSRSDGAHRSRLEAVATRARWRLGLDARQRRHGLRSRLNYRALVVVAASALLGRGPAEPDDELAVHQLGVVCRGGGAVLAIVVDGPDPRVGGGLGAPAADVGARRLVSQHVVDGDRGQRVILAEGVLAGNDRTVRWERHPDEAVDPWERMLDVRISDVGARER